MFFMARALTCQPCVLGATFTVSPSRRKPPAVATHALACRCRPCAMMTPVSVVPDTLTARRSTLLAASTTST